MANVPTTSWDETSPAGSQSILLGDNRIREFKTQVREVIGVDHDFPSSGQAADNGQHLRVTLQEQADLGSGAEGVPILGAQTINSKAELVFTDEDDNDIQITSAGYIDGASVRLDNDESLTATDNAGTGTVSLIKANASDQAEVTPALLADGGVILPEITAPTTAANQGALYTKNDGTQTELYFREESAGDEVQITKSGKLNTTGLGAWVSVTNDSSNLAATDGFLVWYGNVDNGDDFQLLTDASNPPTTIRQRQETGSGTTGYSGSMMTPVKKGDYYMMKVVSGSVGTSATFFIPIGT